MVDLPDHNAQKKLEKETALLEFGAGTAFSASVPFHTYCIFPHQSQMCKFLNDAKAKIIQFWKS